MDGGGELGSLPALVSLGGGEDAVGSEPEAKFLRTSRNSFVSTSVAKAENSLRTGSITSFYDEQVSHTS